MKFILYGEKFFTDTKSKIKKFRKFRNTGSLEIDLVLHYFMHVWWHDLIWSRKNMLTVRIATGMLFNRLLNSFEHNNSNAWLQFWICFWDFSSDDNIWFITTMFENIRELFNEFQLSVTSTMIFHIAKVFPRI